MYIQFLVEDISGSRLIDAIMKKYKAESTGADIIYNIRSFRGIGGIPKGRNAHNNKSQKLLNDLPKRLRAFNVALNQIKNVSLFIVLDNDNRNPQEFEEQLKTLSCQEHINIGHVFCIAVEEMEAWLLGDFRAIQSAYPKLKDRIASKSAIYQQDSICDTWEVLAEMLTKKGFGAFTKQNSTPYDIGRCKIEWTQNIGSQLELRRNVSPNFLKFIAQLDIRCKPTILDV